MSTTRLERDGWVVVVRGEPVGGVEALVERFVRGGLASIAATGGRWSVVADRGERRLVAVDPFGGQPLFLRGAQVVDPLEHRGEVEPRMVAQHLDASLDDPGLTWWRGVRRIPGGHGGPPHAIERIWRPGAQVVHEPERALRDAVESLALPPGTLALSGGLDSSVLAAVGGYERAVRNAFPGWSCDEGPYARAVAERHRIHLVDVDSTRRGPEDVLAAFAPPVFPALLVNHYLNRALLEAASSDLITGFGGDEVFGHGGGALQTWASAGRHGRMWREAFWLTARDRNRPSTPLQRWARYGRSALALSVRDPNRWTDPRERRWRTLTHPLLQRSREEQQQLGMHLGVRVHQPLLDPTLAALCLSIPDTERIDRGRTRAVLRRAFDDVLPALVRDRTDKADLRRSFDDAFARFLPDAWPLIVAGTLEPWRSAPRLRALRTAFESGDHLAGAALWRAYGAARWLTWHAARGRRPV